MNAPTTNRQKIIVGFLLVLVLLLGITTFVFYSTVGLNSTKAGIENTIRYSGFTEIEEPLDDIDLKWSRLGILDISAKKALIHEVEDLRDNLFKQVKSSIKQCKNVDMSNADPQDLQVYNDCISQLDEALTKAPETCDFKRTKELLDQLESAVFLYTESKHALDVSVQQIDASSFPKIKFYLSLKNPSSGSSPQNLDPKFFYIRKKDANAQFIRHGITQAGRLSEMDALSIDMVADISSSMSGQPMSEAKSVMSRFVDSVQFNAGDEVELTSFSSGVYPVEPFTKDAALLKQRIGSLGTHGETSLYDALYYAVERVAARKGARCVIAFTDGDDNASHCTQDDVIALAKRYHIPIFIIGIGSHNTSMCQYIATQTGGMYYSSSLSAMDQIYKTIYDIEKALYVVEFDDPTGATITDQGDIEIGYHSPEYGGQIEYTYRPNVLVSASSDPIYQDGPEAAVANYLKNFPKAVSNNDFALIAPYIQAGSDLYTSQQSFVQRDIQEHLDSYEILDITHDSANSCTISTRETYYVQVQNKPLELLTQECKYTVVKDGNQWLLTTLTDINVVNRIKQ